MKIDNEIIELEKKEWLELPIDERKTVMEDVIYGDINRINYWLHRLCGVSKNISYDNNEKGVSIKIDDGFNKWDGKYISYGSFNMIKEIEKFKEELYYLKSKIKKPIKNDNWKNESKISTPYQNSYIELLIEDTHINFNLNNFQFKSEFFGRIDLSDSQYLEWY